MKILLQYLIKKEFKNRNYYPIKKVTYILFLKVLVKSNSFSFFYFPSLLFSFFFVVNKCAIFYSLCIVIFSFSNSNLFINKHDI